MIIQVVVEDAELVMTMIVQQPFCSHMIRSMLNDNTQNSFEENSPEIPRSYGTHRTIQNY